VTLRRDIASVGRLLGVSMEGLHRSIGYARQGREFVKRSNDLPIILALRMPRRAWCPVPGPVHAGRREGEWPHIHPKYPGRCRR
jgi:hypothetical protein